MSSAPDTAYGLRHDKPIYYLFALTALELSVLLCDCDPLPPALGDLGKALIHHDTHSSDSRVSILFFYTHSHSLSPHAAAQVAEKKLGLK